MSKQQTQSAEEPSYFERFQQVKRMMRFPAMTLIVFTRPDAGYRFLSLTALLATNGLVLLLAGAADPMSNPEHLMIFSALSRTVDGQPYRRPDRA